MAFVFQYGSNMSSSRINSPIRLHGDARFVCLAFTADLYDFEFTVFSKSNDCAAANIHPNPTGRQIWGVVYEIPDNLIKRETAGNRKSLDAIEGEGSTYERVYILLRKQADVDFPMPVITYVALKRINDIRTSAEYAGHIIRGAMEHNLPSDYISYIKNKIIENDVNLRDYI